MRGKFLLAGVAGIVAVAAMFFGGVLGELSSAGKVAAGPARARLAPAKAPRIAVLERLVERSPSDGAALVELGLAYQQRARETADPRDLGRAEAALRRGLRSGGDRYLATTGLAAVAASRHRFEEAVDLAGRAIRIDPDAEAAYGILGDGLVELGRYREGFAAFDHMAARGSDLPALTRVSYARELLGRRQSAIAAMRMAVETASTAENAAWTLVQLGNLEFDGNRLRAAEAAYRRALAVFPGYSHAEAALARIDAARGRLPAAVRRYRNVVARMPLPQYAIALGDTLHRGRPRGGSARDVPARRCPGAALPRERCANRARDRALRPRPRPAIGRCSRPSEAGLRASAEHPCGGRAGMGAPQERPVRRGACTFGPERSASEPTTRSSSFTAA